ncbi:hypothetical protein CLU79DRAFT_785152 [Phycomyces nitens]|nr:hypothetical protein CLU79DRAFT_785152 [Phycomyces nitens]
MTYTPNDPPYPAYRATAKGSFAEDSTIRRWPIIIDSAITEVKDHMDKIDSHSPEHIEGKEILKGIETLKAEILQDKPLRLIHDDESDAESWNANIRKHFPFATWFSGTWLFNECYLYRRLRECFCTTTHWKNFDPFACQKISTFRSSYSSVFALAKKMPELIKPMDKEEWQFVYHELIQVCLWGNATDLSLLTNMTEEDIKRLQATEKHRLEEQRKFIVVDHIDKLWEQLETLENGKIEFVLDNSGFEVFVDLVLADWLIQTKKASQVIFNCKTIPWFVSDVMPKDIPILFESCLDPTFFPVDPKRTAEDVEALENMVRRWQRYVQEGQLVIRSHPFWCSGLSYWYLKSDALGLYNDMKNSDLIIFKGDLNYRKLVFCCDWPVTTPFEEAIGKDMADFTSIVSLRTNKADPIVGLEEGQREEIEKTASYNEWRCSGKYAVVEYSKGSRK